MERFGNIGLSALAPFGDDFIDYTHRRVVLIRLDTAGHRLAPVPAYTPRWSAPLVDMAGGVWGLAVRTDGTLDTLNASADTVIRQLDTGAPSNMIQARKYNDLKWELGYPFLSQLGVIGINQRTHQVYLYH